MAQTIKLKRSNTSGSKPTTSNLALGEIALNTKDGLFFLRRNVDGTDSNDTIRAYTPEYLTEYDSQIDVTVTVATKTSAHPQNGTGSSSGYLLDGLEGPFLVLIPGNTYRFDQSDSSNSSHPLRFYLEADKTTSYTTGVTTNGTAGSSGAYTQIAVTESTPQVLYYQCSSHGYMGSGAFINSGAVTSTQIQANAVTAGKIASNSILTRHIDDNQIGIDQLNVSDGSNGQALTTNGSGTLSFSDVSSTVAGASDVTISGPSAGDLLVHDGSATDPKFLNKTVSGDATLAADGALTIATNAITSTMIAQNSILTKHIDDNQIGIDQLNVTDGSSGQVLTTDGSGTLSFSTVSSGSASDSFKTITISGQSDVVADSATDTLTLAAGTGITLTTNASTDTITITGTTGLSANSVTATHIATGAVGASELASTAVTPGSYTLASITVDADGRITSASSGSSSVSDGSITTAKLADDAVTAAKLADTAVTAGTYGSSTASPQITVDAQGRITSVSNQTISSSGGGGGVGLNLTVDVHEATGDGSTTAFDTGTTILSEDNTTVFVDGVYQEKGTYSTSGSTVTFSSAPPNGVSVEINNLATLTTGGALSHSSFNGDGSTTAFTLPKAPDSETDLIAFIDGVYQNNDSFNVSGTTLTFDTAPANGTKVIIYTVGGVVTGKTHVLNTFDGDASTTAFTLTLDPVHENNTMVYVGGVYQPKGTYSISGTTLTFSEAPPSGTGNIEVNIGQVTTTTDVGANAVNAAAIAANAVGSSEIAGNAVTATQIAAGAVGASEISTSSTPTFAGANITNTSTGDSLLITTTEDTSTAAPVVALKRNSSSPADGDYLGQFKFLGENDADQQVLYAKITAKTSDVTDGAEDGLLEFALRKDGSNSINARLTHSDLKLINSTGLEVAGATTLSSTLGVTGALTASGLTYPTSDGSNGQVLTTNGSGTLSFSTISTDVPTFKEGGTNFTNSIMIGDSSTGTLSSAERNTGIGKDIFAALTEGDGNNVLGYQALDANTTGSNNVAIGESALGANTTGANNIAIGHEALLANTTADDNIAIGYKSMDTNTTGTNNVAIGKNSLRQNSTASSNTAIGHEALKTNSTGSSNVAIGYHALHDYNGNNTVAVGYAALANATGASNTALGHQSLETCTTGSNNTAVGENSAPLLTTGYNNVAVGMLSLRSVTTGYDCTAVGKGALYDLTTGDACSAFGHEAGENVTTAIHGTYIGRRAAQNLTTGGYVTVVGANGATSITSGTYNTLIGYGAGNRSNPLTSGSSCTMVGALTGPSGTLGNANNENVFGFNISANGTGTTTLGAGGSGLYASHGSTGWTAVSDERYKKDITDATLGLSFINDLRPRTFKWKTCGEVPNDTPKYEEGSTEIIHETMPGVMHGFIAQEVKTVIDNHSNVPDNQLIWKETPDGMQNLAKEELIPALVKAVQELSAKNDALETRIQELEG